MTSVEKSKEELDLERIVFGEVDLFNTARNDSGDDLSDSEPAEGDSELEGDELFFVDTKGAEQGDEDEDEPMDQDSSSASESDEPVWLDSDDERMRIDLSAKDRAKKLKTTVTESNLSGREYEKRLRKYFRKMNPTPKWSIQTLDASDDDSDEKDGSDLAANPLGELLAQKSSYLSSKSRKLLPTTNLNIARLPDLNKQRRSKSAIQTLEFNPLHPLALTSGYDRTLRVYHVDGKVNPVATTLHIRDSPFQTALFHPDGNRIFAGGRRKYMYIWDLATGSIDKITRLYGHQNTQKSMENFILSPDGQYMGLMGNNGWFNVLSAQNGQWITGAKIEGVIADAVWNKDNTVTIANTGGDIYDWDSTARKFSSRWKDQAGVGITKIAQTSRWTAIGANNGIVNIYDRNSPKFTNNDDQFKIIEPDFAIDNLVTTVSSLQFNGDEQILAIASRAQRDALKMVHAPSFSVFANWPTSTTPLGRVTSMAFSPTSNFFAAGNEAGFARLWSLESYNQAQ